MAAPAPLTLKNAANADVVFNVDRAEGDRIVWVYKPVGSTMAGWHWLTLHRKAPKNMVSGAAVASETIETPAIDAVTGLIKSTNRRTGNTTIPVQSPSVMCADMAAYIKSLAANPVYQQLLLDATLPQ